MENTETSAKEKYVVVFKTCFEPEKRFAFAWKDIAEGFAQALKKRPLVNYAYVEVQDAEHI